MRGALNYQNKPETFIQNISNLMTNNAYLIFYLADSLNAEQEIIKNASYPFYLKAFQHDKEQLIKYSKKLKLKKILSQSLKTDKNIGSHLLILQKTKS